MGRIIIPVFPLRSSFCKQSRISITICEMFFSENRERPIISGLQKVNMPALCVWNLIRTVCYWKHWKLILRFGAEDMQKS